MDQITDYDSLKAAVAGMIHYDGDTDFEASVPLLIQLAEAEMGDELMPKNSETDAALTLTQGQNYVALPAGFVSPIAFWLVIGNLRTELMPALPQELPYDTGSGQPAFWAIDGANIRFDCPAAQAYSAFLRCVVRSNLSGSVTTNYILARRPDIYLYGALRQAAILNDDDRGLQKWTAMYESAKKAFSDAEHRARAMVPARFDFPGFGRSDIRRGY